MLGLWYAYGGENCIQISSGKLNELDPLEDPEIFGRIILKQTLKSRVCG